MGGRTCHRTYVREKANNGDYMQTRYNAPPSNQNPEWLKKATCIRLTEIHKYERPYSWVGFYRNIMNERTTVVIK